MAFEMGCLCTNLKCQILHIIDIKDEAAYMYSSTVYIRTVSSKRLLSAWENWFMSHLDRSTCTVDLISAQTSQEGIKCTKAK